jgi:hypothetical protein
MLSIMTIVSKKRRVMRTPVVVVTGRGDTDGVAGVLMQTAGTVVVGHDFDGQVVRRWVSNLQHGVLISAELPLELVNGCVSCTTRNDLLVLLRSCTAARTSRGSWCTWRPGVGGVMAPDAGRQTQETSAERRGPRVPDARTPHTRRILTGHGDCT